MKLVLALLFALSSACHAQLMGQSGLLGVTVGGSTTIYGQSTNDGSTDYDGNYLIALAFQTGSHAETVNSCKIGLAASTNANGSALTCEIYTTVSSTKIGSTVTGCTGTYTAGSANLPAQTLTIPFSGCTLAANTIYWIVTNENDAGFIFYQTNGGGAYPSSTYDDQYASETYGTWPSNVTMSDDGERQCMWVVATP